MSSKHHYVDYRHLVTVARRSSNRRIKHLQTVTSNRAIKNRSCRGQVRGNDGAEGSGVFLPSVGWVYQIFMLYAANLLCDIKIQAMLRCPNALLTHRCQHGFRKMSSEACRVEARGLGSWWHCIPPRGLGQPLYQLSLGHQGISDDLWVLLFYWHCKVLF